jgi:hypothetical protein
MQLIDFEMQLALIKKAAVRLAASVSIKRGDLTNTSDVF